MVEALLLTLAWAGGMAFLWGLGLEADLSWGLTVVATISALFLLFEHLRSPRESKKKSKAATSARSHLNQLPVVSDLSPTSMQLDPTPGEAEAPLLNEERTRASSPSPPYWRETPFKVEPQVRDAAQVASPDPAFKASITKEAPTPIVDSSAQRAEMMEPKSVNLYGAEAFQSRGRSAPSATQTLHQLPIKPNTPIGPTSKVRVSETSVGAARPSARGASGEQSGNRVRKTLSPGDFTVNHKVHGFLYLARNPEHWEGLHKVGQTRRHPRDRVGQLNDQHSQYSDIGSLDLLDVVPVVDAYGAEQVMFHVLSEMRPVEKREYFIANSTFLSETMRAVAEFVKVDGDKEWLNRIYLGLDLHDHPSWPPHPMRHNYYGVARSPGWVYLARNRFHKADTYRFGASSLRPEEALRELNNGQTEATSQIGFYTVVFAMPAWDSKQARTIGWRALAPWRLAGSRSFVRGRLDELAGNLVEGLKNHQTSTP